MKKNTIVSVGVCMLLIAAVFVGVVGTVAVDDWPMSQHDLAHTGYSTSKAPETNNTLWTYGTFSITQSSPTIADGKVYIGSDNKNVYCLDIVTGLKIWDYTAEDKVRTAPAVVDGKVYVGTYGSTGELLCLDAAGNGDGTTSKIWNYTVGFHVLASPAIVNNRVYFGCYNKNVYCLNATGNGDGTTNLIWKYTTNGAIGASSPAVVDGRVYIVLSADLKLYCLDAVGNGDGTTNHLWNRTLGTVVFDASPTVVNGKVYVANGQNPGYITCYNAINGQLIWNMTMANTQFYQSSPAFAYGKIYVCSPTGKIFCLDAEGNGDGTTTKIWEYKLPTSHTIHGSPAVADGKVYFNSYGGSSDKDNIFCVDAYGNGDGNTTMIWQYTTATGGGTSPPCSSPSIANGCVFSASWLTSKIYCFRDEHAPETPAKPNGPTEGLVGETYTFTAVTIDPDGDQIHYMFSWGDGTYSSWFGPYDSGAVLSASHQWSIPGKYDITVKAKDIYGDESGWSPIHTVTITNQSSQQNQMQITAAPTVLESTAFTVTITVQSGAVIAGADVTFNDQTKQTNDVGQVIFTAPTVTTNMVYTIIASKEGYQLASTPITVLYQQEENEPQGWIYGLVQDGSRNSLSGVSICAILEDTGVTIKCEQTDNAGNYVFSIPLGTYTITANLQGYEPAIKQNKVVPENMAVDANFVLQTKQSTSIQTSDTTTASVEEFIKTKASLGMVGGRVEVTKNEESIISSYIDGLHIDPNTTGESVRFTVSADDGTRGTILVIFIGEGVLSDLDTVDLAYDDVSIAEESDVAAFFTIHDNPDPAWLRVSTTSGLYVFVRIPHFSTHTITISSIIKAFSGPITILLYITFCIIAGSVFFVKILAHPIYLQYLKRKRY
ncbi:MAG: PQQ-binding-like beta-propeller repeat protein [Euryarchaeota archaeon]|nr:PQQ-binding-like beta-propeller repeat protein [Euryarchaeota archaeon]